MWFGLVAQFVCPPVGGTVRGGSPLVLHGGPWGVQSRCSTAASCSQFCIVALRLRNVLCLCPGMSFRSIRQARYIVCTVQCCRGRPTRFFLREMFGRALFPLNVACLVGASLCSLSVCISSLRCECLACLECFFLYINKLGGWCGGMFAFSFSCAFTFVRYRCVE